MTRRANIQSCCSPAPDDVPLPRLSIEVSKRAIKNTRDCGLRWPGSEVMTAQMQTSAQTPESIYAMVSLDAATSSHAGTHLAPPGEIKKAPKKSSSASGTHLRISDQVAATAVASVVQHASATPDPNKWWTKETQNCPLSQFPIYLLPYPPFKLRINQDSSACTLVDGKYLALHLIANGCMSVCGQPFCASELRALDDYMRRCRLGKFRPGNVATPDIKAAAQLQLMKHRNIQARRLTNLLQISASDHYKRRCRLPKFSTGNVTMQGINAAAHSRFMKHHDIQAKP